MLNGAVGEKATRYVGADFNHVREQPVWNAQIFWRSSNCQMFGQSVLEKVLVFIYCLSGKSLRMTGVTALGGNARRLKKSASFQHSS